MRFLWVDDQPEVATTLASGILLKDWTAEFAADGEDALRMIQSTSYDLVLLDLSMPPGDWGGLWMLEQLKKTAGSKPPVIVVSGEGAQAETIQALRLGAANYVTKEKVHTELQQQIIETLANRGSELMQLIAGGEDDSLEFKSTLRVNLHSGKPDSAMELSCFKTICAFLNAAGGTLLVGVTDEGKACGIGTDGFPNEDRFQLHFWNLFRDAVGAEFCEFVQARIESLADERIFVVTCRPASRPAFLRWKLPGETRVQEHFYVRAGPQTELFGTRQALSYISNHFSDQGR